MRENLQTHSGNRIVVEFDGKVIGLVQSVKMADSYPMEEAVGIGDIHVQEYVPTKATHILTVSALVMMRHNMRDAGVAPQNGDDVLRGLVFDLCIYSKDSGRLLRKYIGCSYESGDTTITANKIVAQTATLKALDVVGTSL